MELSDPRRHANTLRQTISVLSKQLQEKELVIRNLGHDIPNLLYGARNIYNRPLQDKLDRWDKVQEGLQGAQDAAAAARELVEEMAGLEVEAAEAEAKAERLEAEERRQREAEARERAKAEERQRRKEEQRVRREAEEAEATRLAAMTPEEREAEQRLAALARLTR